MNSKEEAEYWRVMSDKMYSTAQDLLELSDQYFSKYMDMLGSPASGKS
jgi:hypothetical protein